MYIQGEGRVYEVAEQGEEPVSSYLYFTNRVNMDWTGTGLGLAWLECDCMVLALGRYEASHAHLVPGTILRHKSTSTS